MAVNYTDSAAVFKAFADENRLKILEILLEGEKCGSELLEKISLGQSTLSHHLKIMCASGIIKSQKKGTATYYSMNPDGAKAAAELLRKFTGADEEKAKEAEKEAEQTAPEAEPAEKKPAVRQTGSRPNGWLL